MDINTALAALKTKLVHSDNFAEIMGGLFDLTEKDAFLKHGSAERNEPIEKMLSMMVGLVMGKTPTPPQSAPKGRRVVTPPLKMLIINMKPFPFYHGSGIIDNRMVAFMYFSDIDKGLISILNGSKTEMVRFTMSQIPGPPPTPPKADDFSRN